MQQASMFALFMGLSNFGSAAGEYVGSAMLRGMHMHMHTHMCACACTCTCTCASLSNATGYAHAHLTMYVYTCICTNEYARSLDGPQLHIHTHPLHTYH